MNTPVDPAKDAYGSLPLCRKAGQAGCVISYVSFRADSPPPANSKFFGKVAEQGMKAACVNPAALLAGKASARCAAISPIAASWARPCARPRSGPRT
jgi:hypothetical protein